MRWWPYTIVSTIVVLTYFSLSNVGRAHRQEAGGDRPQLFTTTPCCCNRVLRRKFSTAITAQDSGFGIRGSLVWGGSAIRGPDSLFHMFASRWDERLGHGAWVMSSEVVHGTSPSPLGPFEFRAVVLPRRGPAYWDGMATHNPTVHWDPSRREYALFYTGITYSFPPPEPAAGLFANRSAYELAWNSKRIGVAFSRTLDGPWRRLDAPVLPTSPAGAWDAGITSNAAPYVAADGSVTLFYKSIACGYPERNLRKGVRFHIGAARAPTAAGPYTRVGSAPILVWGAVPLVAEDPFAWRCTRTGVWHLLFKNMASLKRSGQSSLRAGELAYTHTIAGKGSAGFRWAMPRPAFNRTVSVYRDAPEAEAAAAARLRRARRACRAGCPRRAVPSARGGAAPYRALGAWGRSLGKGKATSKLYNATLEQAEVDSIGEDEQKHGAMDDEEDEDEDEDEEEEEEEDEEEEEAVERMLVDRATTLHIERPVGYRRRRNRPQSARAQYDAPQPVGTISVGRSTPPMRHASPNLSRSLPQPFSDPPPTSFRRSGASSAPLLVRRAGAHACLLRRLRQRLLDELCAAARHGASGA